MRRPVIALLVVFAACAQPVNRPGPAPAPVLASYPLVLQSGGPDGESPPPSAPILAPAVSVAAGGNGNAERLRDLEKLRERHLMIPVVGVSADHLQDTFYDGRDGGDRQHNAIDILAPRNTPIVAADDGVILRMSSNALGGITIFATDADHRFVYYYAHLDHYDGS